MTFKLRYDHTRLIFKIFNQKHISCCPFTSMKELSSVLKTIILVNIDNYIIRAHNSPKIAIGRKLFIHTMNYFLEEKTIKI